MAVRETPFPRRLPPSRSDDEGHDDARPGKDAIRLESAHASTTPPRSGFVQRLKTRREVAGVVGGTLIVKQPIAEP